MKNTLIIFSITILLMSQYGCDKDNRRVLANNYLISQIDSASNHLLTFSNFEKVDGIERQKESTIYEMTFKGFVRAVKDCYWDGHINSSASASSLAEGLYGSSYGIRRNGLLAMKVSISLETLNQEDNFQGQYSLYKKGDGHFVKGHIIFEKRDSGWKIIEMDIKHDQEAADAYVKNHSLLPSQKTDTTSNIKNRSIVQYGGDFSYGSAKQASGYISVYPENDSTLLFYLDISRGAPSYNMGALYGKVKIVNDDGIFYSKTDYDERGCKLSFTFIENRLIIKTIEPFNECGFGNGVEADGIFNKTSSKIPSYFEDMGGTKVYFKNTKPEDYNP